MAVVYRLTVSTYHIALFGRSGYYFFAARFVRLLFKGGAYFFGKPTDINDGWIRYVQAIQ